MRFNRSNIVKVFLSMYLLIIMVPSVLVSCKNEVKKEVAPADLSSLPDEKLAKTMCGRCHLFPSPDLLNKATWVDKVLPEMAYYVGIKPLTEKMFATNEKDFKGLLASGYFPNNPLLQQKDWDRLVAYYKTNAPDSLAEPKQEKLPLYTNCQYDVQTASKGELPFICHASYCGDDLYVGDANSSVLTIYHENTDKKDTLHFASPVSDVMVKNENKYILQIGMMNPNDRFLGKLIALDAKLNKKLMIDSLNRPVDLNMADLNEDGIDDYIICNFGDKIGSLAWYDGKSLKSHTLMTLPGSRVTYVRDFNNDGRNDVMALFSQGKEKISVFYNKGKGQFEEVVIATFPSVFGSSYIALADINGDGNEDILYTAGDNADLSKISKPYHGVYLLTYQSKDKYVNQYFYHLNGASMVKCTDIDGDKDIDLVVTSYFPASTDRNRILVFENKRESSFVGKYDFKVSVIDHASKGNWLVCDINEKSKEMVFGCMSFPQTGNLGGEALIKVRPKIKKG